MALPNEKKSNTGAVVAGTLAGLGFLGALIGVAAGGKKPARRPQFGRPPVRRRGSGKGCGR